MKVSAQRIPQSQVVLEIEIEPEQMERSLERAYRRLVQRVEIPGFRKGKAPRAMLERHLGRHRLLHEALDIIIPEAYNRALDEHEIDAIDQPVIEVLQEEPVIFKATVPVRPTVELGDYRSLRVEPPSVSVDPQQVEAALEDLRHRYALHQPVDRPVQWGDIVRAEVRGVIDGREVFNDDDFEFVLREGSTVLLPGFAEGVVGAEKGVPREVTVQVPEGSRPLSGKSGTFTVVVKEVKEEQLPALDDQFAREVGEGFPSLEALRRRLEDDIRQRLEGEAEAEFHERIVDALVEQAKTIEFPPVLVEREIDRMLREEARAIGQDVDRYLEMMRRSVQEVRDEMRPRAVERVRRSLALGRLAEEEGISVEPAEIEAEIQRIAASAGPQAPQVRQLLSTGPGRESIERSILTRKTLDRLAAIARGEDPSRQQEQAPAASPEAGERLQEEKA